MSTISFKRFVYYVFFMCKCIKLAVVGNSIAFGFLPTGNKSSGFHSLSLQLLLPPKFAMLMFPIVHSEIDLSLTRYWFFYADSSRIYTGKEKRCLEMIKHVRCLLNKVTPQNIQVLAEQFQEIPVKNATELNAIACLLHEKAVDEESYSALYAQVCKTLFIQFLAKPNTLKYPDQVSFQELVITCCQNFFETKPILETYNDEVLDLIFDAAMNPELLTCDEAAAVYRVRAIGNAKFIGELFKVDMLSKGIIHRCAVYLLNKDDELSMECLCRLIATVGKKLQNECEDLTVNPNYYFLQYFNKMNERLARTDFSSRVKFVIQDLIELKNNNWVPRHSDEDGEQEEDDGRRRTSPVFLRLHV